MAAWVEVFDPEWETMWGFLMQEYGDVSQECIDCRETWQYVGSSIECTRWVHTFRHRHHPVEKEQIYFKVIASGEWRPGAFKAN